MCRIAAYKGPKRSLHELWLEAEHNLEVQSYAPQEMLTARLNADGFGMAWYTEADRTPAAYRTVLPLWGDENVRKMAKHLVSGCALANIRSATIGMSIQASNVSPFVRGRWAFTHNGFIKSFRERMLRPLRAELDDVHYAAIEGTTDSEHLFGLTLMQLEKDAQNEDPSSALRKALLRVSELAEKADASALLNIVITDGHHLAAARHAIGETAPTLYLKRYEDGGHAFASEALDKEGWEKVAAHTITVIDPEGRTRSEAI